MTNATKTLALFFVGTLAMAVATAWSGGGSSSAAFQDKLLAVDSSAVEAVRIERPKGSVRLVRSGDGWNVRSGSQSPAYRAQDQTIERLLSEMPALQVNAVATRQTDKHPRYGVDSTGTTVTMLDANDEPLGSLLIGRTEFRSNDQSQQQTPGPMQQMRQNRGTQVTYVRTPDKPDVYSVEKSLASLVNRNVEDWRDKSIWGVAQSKIQRVDLTMSGDSTAAANRSYTLQRTAASDTSSASSTWTSNGDTLSTDAVSSLLRIVSSPRANSFANDKSPDNLSNPRYTVRLQLADGTERTLTLYPDSADDETYLATATDYPYVARVLKSRWDDSVFKSRSSLLSK